MARETKAQREERYARERAEFEAQQAAEYPVRFRTALNEALQENFELESVSVVDAAYHMVDRNESDRAMYMVYSEYSRDALNSLNDLERAVRDRRWHREEATRKYQVRQAALAKLNAEERELLGLKY